MIVVPDAGALRLITQPDHAHFAAELLSLFRLPELLEHPRRDELLRAVREHDNGWREADAAPRVDPASGVPYSFLDLPRRHRLEIWRRGCRRHIEQRPYVALLIIRHALALHSGAGDRGDASFLDELLEQQEELLERCGLTREALAEDYRWLELADAGSLAVCGRLAEPFTRHGWRAEATGERLRLDPFPLAGATTFRVPCRYLADRRFGGDAELGAALAEARWQRLTVRVVDGAAAALQ
jgi:hypothetical protein